MELRAGVNVTPRGEHAREAQTQTRTQTEQRAGKRTPARAPNPKAPQSKTERHRGEGGKAEQRENEHVHPAPKLHLRPIVTHARHSRVSQKTIVLSGCLEAVNDIGCIYACEQPMAKPSTGKVLSSKQSNAQSET